MSLGWLKTAATERTIKTIIKKIIHNMDQIMQKDPGLSVEETLKIIDKKQGVFFPGDQTVVTDLKSLFTMVIWKAYRNARLSDPDASSPDHRELVAKLVHHYLNDEYANQTPGYKKVLTPLTLGVSASLAVLVVGTLLLMRPWATPGTVSSVKNPQAAAVVSSVNNEKASHAVLSANDETDPPPVQSSPLRYYGYASDDRQKMALVNRSMYHEGDVIDEENGYLLKSIHPYHIVVQNMADNSEFSVVLQ